MVNTENLCAHCDSANTHIHRLVARTGCDNNSRPDVGYLIQSDLRLDLQVSIASEQQLRFGTNRTRQEIDLCIQIECEGCGSYSNLLLTHHKGVTTLSSEETNIFDTQKRTYE